MWAMPVGRPLDQLMNFDEIGKAILVAAQACVNCQNVYARDEYKVCEECRKPLCCMGCAQFHYGEVHKSMEGMVILL